MTKRFAMFLSATGGICCLFGLLRLSNADAGRATAQPAPSASTRIAAQRHHRPYNRIATGNEQLFEAAAAVDASAQAASAEKNEETNDVSGAEAGIDARNPALARAAHANVARTLTPEEMAAAREAFMREEFGVVRAGSHWIPTVAGGTNIVYIITGSLPTGWVGEPFEVQFQATSGFPPYRWSIAGGELPPGLMLDAGSGFLSGTPLEAASSTIFLQVSDSQGTKDVAEYTLAFQPEDPLEIVTESLPAAYPGEDYLFTLEAKGGVPPYAWGMQGALDESDALAIDAATGALYGHFPESTSEFDLPVTIFLADSQLRVTRELTLHVRSKLVILQTPASPVREGDSFAFTFEATGGQAPYTWGLAAPLPPGLTFTPDGCCTGTFTRAGAYEISLWVHDIAGLTATAQFPLEVQPAALAVTGFEALLSRNSVALAWNLPTQDEAASVRIIRESDSGMQTVYEGRGTSFLDRDVGRGSHNYTAVLEHNGTVVTSAVPPKINVSLPPEADPFVDKVTSHRLLHPNAFRIGDLPGVALGAPRGTGLAWGSTDVVSLGAATCNDGGATAPYGGTITLEFTDNLVWNGPGPDFTVFENVFYICNADGVPDPETRFMEPAFVAVSQDGVNWKQFKTDFSPRYDPETGELNLRHPYCYNSGFAGVNPVMSNGYEPDPTDPSVSGGDSFDIGELGFDWIKFVRIQSTGNRWLVDSNGNLIHHIEDQNAADRNSTKSGFDLDAVSAVWMIKVKSDYESGLQSFRNGRE